MPAYGACEHAPYECYTHRRGGSNGHVLITVPGVGFDHRTLGSPLQRLAQILVDLVQEAHGGQPFLVRANQQRQILGHVAALDGFEPAIPLHIQDAAGHIPLLDSS